VPTLSEWWTLVSPVVTIAGSGIVTYFVTRATARRALADDREKQRHAVGFEKRREWYDRMVAATTELLRANARAIAAAEQAGVGPSLTDALQVLRERTDAARRESLSAPIYGSQTVVNEVLRMVAVLARPDPVVPVTASEATVMAMLASDLRSRGHEVQQCWEALLVESRAHLGYEGVVPPALSASIDVRPSAGESGGPSTASASR
jgi:hypothetical protein